MKFSSMFSDHAVLQRDIGIPVWGWCKPLSAVVVKLGNAKVQSCSGSDGKFFVRLPPMKAGGPFVLEASCGDEKAVSQDIKHIRINI